MKPTASTIFLFLALVCFILAALGVPKLGWRDAGYAMLVCAYLAG